MQKTLNRTRPRHFLLPFETLKGEAEEFENTRPVIKPFIKGSPHVLQPLFHEQEEKKSLLSLYRISLLAIFVFFKNVCLERPEGGKGYDIFSSSITTKASLQLLCRVNFVAAFFLFNTSTSDVHDLREERYTDTTF